MTGWGGKRCASNDGNQIVRLDKFAALVYEHRAVCVAVEYDAAVKPLLADDLGNLLSRFGLERIRGMGGEGPVGSVVEQHRIREHLAHEKRGHSVRAVYGEL